MTISARRRDYRVPVGEALPNVLRVLQDGDVRLDCRGPVLRLSFHIYNTAAEAAFVARCLCGELRKLQ